jgi:hypothetical protein
MGTARLFSKVLHKEIDVHAAWMPVTNNFGLGDYGVISDGVFVKMGNIDEYGVSFTKATGKPTRIKFRSDGTSVRRFVGETEVNALPEDDINARLVIGFTAADSFYIDAHLRVEAIDNLAQAARALRDADGWPRKYRVISETYTGHNCTIISSRKANSSIEISGKTSALKQLELGKAEVGLTVSAEDSVGLEVVGRTGVVGLRMFKLRALTGRPRILGKEEEAAEGAQEDLVDQETAAELSDDI